MKPSTRAGSGTLTLALLAALALPAAVGAQATITATPIEHTAFGPADDRALAEHWGLQPEEVARYRRYMQVEGRFFYAHLDPVMVLGLIETDPGRRARYAEQYLDAERRRIGEQTGFAALVAATQRKRYGAEALVDFSTLPQAAHSPGYREARAARLGPTTPAASAAPAPAPQPAAPPTVQVGDTVDLLVEAGCTTPCHAKLNEILRTPGVKVLLYGRGFADPPALLAWLERWSPPDPKERAALAGRVEPRRFDPVVFAGIDIAMPPVALLRRDGAVIGTL